MSLLPFERCQRGKKRMKMVGKGRKHKENPIKLGEKTPTKLGETKVKECIINGRQFC